MLPISAKFAAALAAGTLQWLTQVTVWGQATPGDAASYQQLLPAPGETISILSGSTSVDTTQPVWGTLQATLGDPGGWLTPRTLFDPLTPFGNELRVQQGIQYADGTQELIPVGVYPLTVVNPVWTGAQYTIQVQGSDRASNVGLRMLKSPFNIATGQSLGQVVESLIGSLMPNNAQLNINPAAYSVTMEATTFYQGDNPWTDAQTAAVNAGFILYFDAYGNAQLQPTPNFPGQSPAWSFGVGQGTLLRQASRVLSQSGPNGPIANDYLMVYEGTSTTYTANPPVQAEVSETNPASPFDTGGRYGDVPFFDYTSVLQGTSAATAAAQQMLTLGEGEADTLTLSTLPNPALQPYDVVTVDVPQMYIDGPYYVQALTTPFGPGTQSLTVVEVT